MVGLGWSGVWGLGFSVPASIVFHEEEIAFFYHGVRCTPKISKTFIGFPPKMLNKVGGCMVPQRAFSCAEKWCWVYSPQSGEWAAPHRGAGKNHLRDHVTLPLWSTFWGNPKLNFQNLWGVPLTWKSEKCKFARWSSNDSIQEDNTENQFLP